MLRERKVWPLLAFIGIIVVTAYVVNDAKRRISDVRETPRGRKIPLPEAQRRWEQKQLKKREPLIQKLREKVPLLVQNLSDADVAVRRKASLDLSNMGRLAEKAAPALVQALEDEDHMVRAHAAAALGGIGSFAREGVPALIQALHDNDPQVRWAAAGALGKIGPEAKDAVPELLKLRDETKYDGARHAASKALERIQN